MNKLLLSLLIMSYAYASTLYGTAANPQIDGQDYDVHQVYIEPNQGYHPQVQATPRTIASTENQSAKQYQVVVNSPKNQQLNFKSDSWATNSKVEKVLQKAASNGKLGYVLDQAKKSNLPASVAILPIVESNYNKDAISPKGAGGAWQLMPGTANDYGLSFNDRFDFNMSTQAAIGLLNDLYKEFGNWALAFAAYNCGSKCVKTALKKNPSATDIDELSLPRETKDYVHRLIHLNQVIAGLDKTNFR